MKSLSKFISLQSLYYLGQKWHQLVNKNSTHTEYTRDGYEIPLTSKDWNNCSKKYFFTQNISYPNTKKIPDY